jgi:hypothetical protein
LIPSFNVDNFMHRFQRLKKMVVVTATHNEAQNVCTKNKVAEEQFVLH